MRLVINILIDIAINDIYIAKVRLVLTFCIIIGDWLLIDIAKVRLVLTFCIINRHCKSEVGAYFLYYYW